MFMYQKVSLFCLLTALSFHTFGQELSKDSTFVFYFNSGKSVPQKQSLILFKKFYANFKTCENCVFLLSGFADSVGSVTSNLELSQARVENVRKLLASTTAENVKQEFFGEQFAQEAINKQDFRKVSVSVHQQRMQVVTEEEWVHLSPKERRFREFDARGKTIRLNILFHLNSTDILKESQEDIDLLAEYLLENPNVKAKLFGHVCCNNNLILSRSRALQIKVFLVKKGVQQERLSAEGFGNTKPQVKEIDAAAEQVNRRVEVMFFEC